MPTCCNAAEGLQSSGSITRLQTGKAAADSRLAALMAELQAFKQETADAEAKSRADRKVSTVDPCCDSVVLVAILPGHSSVVSISLDQDHVQLLIGVSGGQKTIFYCPLCMLAESTQSARYHIPAYFGLNAPSTAHFGLCTSQYSIAYTAQHAQPAEQTLQCPE